MKQMPFPDTYIPSSGDFICHADSGWAAYVTKSSSSEVCFLYHHSISAASRMTYDRLIAGDSHLYNWTCHMRSPGKFRDLVLNLPKERATLYRDLEIEMDDPTSFPALSDSLYPPVENLEKRFYCKVRGVQLSLF